MIQIAIGVILILSGFTLRIAAIRTLRDCFTLQLGVPQRIVTSGLYRWVRHPSYLGSLIMIVGLSLVCIYLALAYLAFVFFMARIVEEEAILNLGFPGVYSDYRRRTGALLPKIPFKKKG